MFKFYVGLISANLLHEVKYRAARLDRPFKTNKGDILVAT